MESIPSKRLISKCLGIAFIFCLLVFTASIKAKPAFADAIKGYIDNVSCENFAGWSCSSYSYTTSYPVVVTIDTNNQGTWVPANIQREVGVASQCGGQANHGFSIDPRAWFPQIFDGRPHTITVQGSDATHLWGLISSPRTITCATPLNTPPPVQTLYVCPTGGVSGKQCDYFGGDGIQQAIDAASSVIGQTNGSEIIIRKGIYSRQNYTAYTNIINKTRKAFLNTKSKNLAIIGEPGATLDGAHSSKMSGIAVVGGSVSIRGLTVSGFQRGDCVGAQDAACSDGDLILSRGGATIYLQNNLIINNNAEEGVIAYEYSRIYSTNNTYASNNVAGVIYSIGQSFINSQNDLVAFNGSSAGYMCQDSSTINLQYDLNYNPNGTNFWKVHNTCNLNGQLQALIQDPLFENVTDLNFHIKQTSPARNAGDPNILDPDKTRSDIGVYGGPNGALGCTRNLPVLCNANGTSATFRWDAVDGASKYVLRIDKRDSPPSPTPEWMSAGDQWIMVPRLTPTPGFACTGTSCTTGITPGAPYNGFSVQGVADGDIYPYNSCNEPGEAFTCNAGGNCLARPYGDTDCNWTVDLIDFEEWRKEFVGESASKNADFSGNGTVGLEDFEIWRQTFTTGPLPTLAPP